MTDDHWVSLADYPEQVAAAAMLGLLTDAGLPCYIASDAHVPGLGSVFSIRVPAAVLGRAQALIEHGAISDSELTELALRAPPEDSGED